MPPKDNDHTISTPPAQPKKRTSTKTSLRSNGKRKRRETPPSKKNTRKKTKEGKFETRRERKTASQKTFDQVYRSYFNGEELVEDIVEQIRILPEEFYQKETAESFVATSESDVEVENQDSGDAIQHSEALTVPPYEAEETEAEDTQKDATTREEQEKQEPFNIEYVQESIGDDDEEIDDIFQRPSLFSSFKKKMPKHWLAFSTMFLAVSFMLILPFEAVLYYQSLSQIKKAVIYDGKDAFTAIESGRRAIQSLRLQEALSHFQKAKRALKNAQKRYESINTFSKVLISILPSLRLKTSTSLLLLEAGEDIAEGGEYAVHALQQLSREFDSGQFSPDQFFQSLLMLQSRLDTALPKISQAKSVFSDPVLSRTQQGLEDISSLNRALLQIFGYTGWQRYLVVFQNNRELRPTGGFIGSYALVDVEDGRIVNLEIPAGGSYDLQGYLTAFVSSPHPLRLINPIWEFQDANWWPNFPFTAKKIIWFYDKAQGPTVDGVIAINADFMEDILRIIGPISVEQYGQVITAENFIDETQKIVEKTHPERNKPKQFLSDLAPLILNRITSLEKEQMWDLLDVVVQGLREKKILLYSQYPEIENIILTLNWGGEQETDIKGDYLSIIFTNIAGGKTDGVIQTKIFHQAKLYPDGRIIDTLTLTRSHLGSRDDEFTGLQNNSYIRIYTPPESILLSVEEFDGPPQADLFERPPSGYHPDEDLLQYESKHRIDPKSQTEIYEENNKTVFANWMMLKPGETKTAILQYELSKSITKNASLYSLVVQKQPGTKNIEFISHFIIPEGRRIVQTYPLLSSSQISLLAGSDNIHFEENSPIVQFQNNLKTDAFFAVVFK